MRSEAHMLLINDRKPPGHANIRPYIDRKGGLLFCLLRSASVLF